MTRTVGVTGATGFIGRAFCAAAADAQVPVIAIGRDQRALASLPGSVETRRIDDLCDQEQATEALRGADIVLHLADQADRIEVSKAGSPSVRLATAMAGAARTLALDGVILASSIYATLAEQGRTTTYGGAKLAAENILREAGAPCVILRLPPVYGRGEKGSIAALASLVRRGLPLPFGSARAGRDYLYVDNLAQLLLAVATAPVETLQAARGRPLEPSDGRPISTAELIGLIGGVQGQEPRVFPFPPALLLGVARLAGQVDRVRAAFEPLRATGNEALEQLFGWEPRQTMPETLAYLAKA